MSDPLPTAPAGGLVPAARQRFALLDAALGLGLDLGPDLALRDAVTQVLDLDGRTLGFRAVVALLAASAVYPMAEDANALVAALRHGRRDDASAVLADAVQHAGAAAFLRRLAPAPAVSVDVSSVSREQSMSGIPRVTRDLVRGGGAGTGTHVWSYGAAGALTLTAAGRFVAPPEVWASFAAEHWPLRPMRDIHRHLREAGIASNAVRAVDAALMAAARPLLPLLEAGPRVGLLFTGCDVVVPEVCARDVADRLLAWRQHVGACRLSAFVHDLLPVTAPRFFAPQHPSQFLDFLPVVAAADRVVTTTAATAAQVEAFCGLVGAPRSDVVVAPLPVGSAAWGEVPAPAEVRPQFTCVGTLEPRKNHATLLQAATLLARRKYPVVLNLVGRSTWVTGEARRWLRLARQAGVEVRLVSGASDARLKGLLRASVATVFVSWAEGYGLPVPESLACGVPVIASDVVPLREFAAYGGVLLVDPADPYALADTMLGLIQDPDARDRLAAAIDVEAIPASTSEWAARVLGRGERS